MIEARGMAYSHFLALSFKEKRNSRWLMLLSETLLIFNISQIVQVLIWQIMKLYWLLDHLHKRKIDLKVTRNY